MLTSKLKHGLWTSFPVLCVAAKKILKATDDKDRIEQGKEVQYLRRLNHPNIIEFYGTVVDSDELIIVTEYASKGSLDDYLGNERKHGRKLPQDQVYDWAIQAAKAIRYLQEMKVAHRDIKSPNFVITADHVLKLCDFGIAKDLSVSVSVDSIKGTYRWLAPEVFKEQRLSPASDLFSYGIVVWEMQACDVPYRGLTVPAHIMYKVGTENMRPTIPADCPDDIKVLMQQCWDAEREKRPIIDEAIVALCRSKRAALVKSCPEQGNYWKGEQKSFHSADRKDANAMITLVPAKCSEDNSNHLKAYIYSGTSHAEKSQFKTRTEADDKSVDTGKQPLNTLANTEVWRLNRELLEGQTTKQDQDHLELHQKLGIEIHNDWEVVSAFSPVENKQADLGDSSDVASFPDGSIAVSNPTKKSVLVFDRSRKYSKSLYFPGARCEERHFRPGKIAITSQSHIYVTADTDLVSYRCDYVNVFDWNDKFVSSYRETMSNMYIDQNDVIFIGDISKLKVYSNTSRENFTEIPVETSTIKSVDTFAVNGNGHVIVAVRDDKYPEVVAIDSKGNELFEIDCQHIGRVISIDTDGDNNIYILTIDSLWQFSSDGKCKKCIARISGLVLALRAMTISRQGELIILAKNMVFVIKLKST